MNIRFIFAAVAVLLTGLALSPASAQGTKKQIKSVKENTSQVKRLNAFVDELLSVHRYRLKTRKINKIERVGGYARMPDHYRDIEYRDAENGRLLSRIRWENKKSGDPEMIEVYFHDKQGRVSVDYMAIFLPGYRNAPFQALINVHAHDDALSAFRQFDPFGDTLFERCQGDHFGAKIDFWLDELDIPPSPDQAPNEVYVSCFGFLPKSVDKYVSPAALVPGMTKASLPDTSGDLTHDKLESRLAELNRKIEASPKDADLYAKRGRDYLMLRKFEDAIEDFTKAIGLNDSLDAAYFGRGMAFARAGELDKGISDLTVFIRRNPESSLAYTKRGVRYIWKKDFESALKDLTMAVSLDAGNAEAHDDLGVTLAQLGKIDEALKHFLKAKALEPGYQKVHHNLAMIYFMTGDLDRALPSVDESLRLQPQNRSSMLLKGNILAGLGRDAEAEKVKATAEFLSQGNWSERSAIR